MAKGNIRLFRQNLIRSNPAIMFLKELATEEFGFCPTVPIDMEKWGGKRTGEILSDALINIDLG